MTKKQLLVAIYKRGKKDTKRMEKVMADLTETVANLRGAVDAAVGRLQDKLIALMDANAGLNAALEAAQLDDADAAAALEASNAATFELQSEINELSSVGVDAPAEEPVDPPVEPPVEDPNNPVVNPPVEDPNAPPAVDPNQPV